MKLYLIFGIVAMIFAGTGWFVNEIHDADEKEQLQVQVDNWEKSYALLSKENRRLHSDHEARVTDLQQQLAALDEVDDDCATHQLNWSGSNE